MTFGITPPVSRFRFAHFGTHEGSIPSAFQSPVSSLPTQVGQSPLSQVF